MKRAALLAVLAVCLLVLGAVGMALFTRAGFAFAVLAVDELAGEALTIEGGSGRLVDEWRLTGLRLSLGGHRLEIAELACRWQPGRLWRRTLLIERLGARGVAVEVGESSTTPSHSAPDRSGALPALLLPIAVQVEDFSVEEMSLRRGEEQLFAGARIQARLSLADGILAVSSLQIEADGAQVNVAGEVHTGPRWPLDLQAKWSLQRPGCSRLQGRTTLTGDLVELRLAAQFTAPTTLAVQGVINHPFETPAWEVQGSGSAVDPSLFCADWPSVALDVSLAATGSGDVFRGSLAGALHQSDYPELSVDLQFAGDAGELQVAPSPIRFGDDGGELSGRLSWSDDLRWDATLLLESWQPGRFVPALAGTLAGELRSTGTLGPAGLRWQGTITDLRYNDGALAGPLTATGQVHGDGDDLQADLILSAGSGRMRMSATARLQERFEWQGRLRAESVDPSFFPDLPAGSVDGELFAFGSGTDEDLELAVRLERLSGDLAGYELQGGGRFEVRDGRLQIDALHLENGDNRLAVQGVIDDRVEVNFHLQGEELSRLYAPLGGRVDLSGHLSGAREAPRAVVELQADHLSYDAYRLDRVSGTLQYGRHGAQSVDLRIDLEGLSGSGVTLERAGLEMAGALGDHRLAVALDGAGGRLHLTANGGWREERRWRGTVEELSLHAPELGGWDQVGSSGVEIGADRLAIDTLCLAGGPSSLCVEGSWEENGAWSAELSDLQVDLADLQHRGAMAPAVTGLVSGRASAAGNGTLLRRLSGTFSAPRIAVPVNDDSWLPKLFWSDNEFSIELVDADLQGRLRSRFSDGSTIEADLQLAEVVDLAALSMSAPIGGTVRIRRVDPLPLAVLTDDYLQPTGRLTAELNLGGTIGHPRFSGSLRLVDGRLGFPELGIGLEELRGTVAGIDQRLSFELQARSGAGTVRGSGGLDFSGTDWSGTFTIDGTDCDLLQLSELQIVVSPSVRLRIGPDGGDLTGVVRVPRALIQPEEMQGSVGASADVVFVDQVEPSTAWPFLLDVQVVFDDQVVVKGYGLNAGLDGFLDVSGRADQGLVGRGELRIVRGTFSLYGTPLQISRGRLVFGGGAIDNPELDIVAQKTVQSAAFNGKGALVGVTVSGTAQDYYLELFSEPSMPDNDIVAYLLLDKPIGSGDDQARGLVSEAMSAVGLAAGNVLLDEITGILPIDDLHLEGSAESRRASLVVAKRLTDQLSISYDFNLFEHAGAFRVRYEFGRGFSVQSRSSVEANGLEVLYTFER